MGYMPTIVAWEASVLWLETLWESLAPKNGWLLLLEVGEEILNWEKQQMSKTQRETNF